MGERDGVIVCGRGKQAIGSGGESGELKAGGGKERGGRWAEQAFRSGSDWLWGGPCPPMGFLPVPALSPRVASGPLCWI